MFITFENFKKLDEYQQFLSENPDTGTLRVQAFTAYGAIPIADTEIVITKDIGDYHVTFFQGKTDSSGIISNIQLPAPKTEKVASSETPPQYTLYDLAAINVDYETIKKYSVGMFGGVGIVLYIKMNPKIDLSGGNVNGN